MPNNPLFKVLGGGAPSGGNDPRFMQMVNMFAQFRSQFQGDPIQKVQQMMNNGEMSQSQYNQLRGMAEQIARLLPR